MNVLAHTGDKIQINLLGAFRVDAPDGREIALHGKKKQGLLAYLALSRDCTATRNQLINIFWSQRDSAKQANPSLRTALSEMRKLFGAAGYPGLLDSDRTSVSLNLARVRVDSVEMLRLGRSKLIADKRRALDLYRGELLEGLVINDRAFEEWLHIERIQYRELYREILHELVTHAIDDNACEEGYRLANRILDFDSTDEEAHRALMMLYQSEGKPALALKQYQVCCEALRRELDTVPSEETTRLHEVIKQPHQPPGTAALARGAEISSAVLQTRDSLSVGVAPFWGQGGGDEAEFLASGISEDIIGALSPFKWMSVKPRSATFSLRAHTTDAVEIGRTLGIRYIVDGSVRQLRDSVRVSVELIEVETGSVMWSSHYDGKLNNNLSIQDEITAQVVSQIDARVRMNEVTHALKWHTDNPKAYDCLLLAISSMHEMTRETFRAERELFRKAVQLDPNFATVYSWWALREVFYYGQGWERESREGESPVDLAQKAISLDPSDAIALAICAHSRSFIEHDFAGALEYFARSMEENPNSAFTWMLSSATYSYCGEPGEALRRLEHSTYLCPVEPIYEFMYSSAKCLAHSFARDYREAAKWGRRLVRESPHFTNGIKQLLVPLGHLGATVEAREYTRRLLELEPKFTIESYRKKRPFKNPEDREEFVEGLIKAGVPRE